MSSQEIDIESQSMVAVPSNQAETEETTSTTIPEYAKGHEKLHNERGDTGGRLPYIDKIIGLSETQRRYEPQASKWRQELKLTPHHVLENRDTFTATFDEFFGTTLRVKHCKNESCYVPGCKGCSEGPICAIIDTFSETLSVQSFVSSEIENEFCEALKASRPDVKTRIILVTLWNTCNTKERWGKESRNFWPNMPSATLVDLLGTKYDLEPLFFDQMMSNKEREFWGQYTIPDTRKVDTSPRYNFMSQIEQTCLLLGFDEEGGERVSPRIWTIVKTGYPNLDQNIVILFQLPEICSWKNSWEYSNNISTIDTNSPRLAPRLAKETFAHAVEKVQQFSSRRIRAANKTPLDFLLPFLESLELHFLQEMTIINTRIREQDEDTWRSPKQSDDLLRTSWVAARSAIEDFQIICDRIQDFSEHLLPEDSKPSKEMTYFMQRCKKTLHRARLSEQYIRDTVQINVGTLALEESRKSIQQANSVGRLTFLGFVFLPLSLVMSFYGMNINEITGQGASWKAFLSSTLILFHAVLLVCSFVFKEMERVKFISRAPLVPFICVMIIILEVFELFPPYRRITSARSANRAMAEFVGDWWRARIGFRKGEK